MDQTITRETSGGAQASTGTSERDPSADAIQLSAEEHGRLLRIVCQIRSIRRHFELFELVRGDVQQVLPHQILLSAWGSFGAQDVALDVISAVPDVRTASLAFCDIRVQLRALHERWLQGGRQSMLLDPEGGGASWLGNCGCPMHWQLRAMRAHLLHGVHCARDGTDTLYLVGHTAPFVAQGGMTRFCRLVDLVLTQVDSAFRRVAGFRVPGSPNAARHADGPAMLSPRESEILALVSRGQTNLEIAAALGISLYTVKNHVQRIIRKLGAGNRTGAAATYRALGSGRLATEHEAIVPRGRNEAASIHGLSKRP